MPTLADDATLTYTLRHEAWYAPALKQNGSDMPDAVYVHSSAQGGGVHWEFSIEDGRLNTRRTTVLRMFDDAYRAFTEVPEFFAALAAEQPTHLTDVVAILDRIGAVDDTARVDPYG
ncbi:hypothetical protein [Nocardia sp. CC227C]|uniref:hypothetical protein n=1 Tax=Nocardia sp. CC227C TaxID=3044562 RepID=UPI00278BF027|nr:hypothetical protein [Nocardia sp. CC227C]